MAPKKKSTAVAPAAETKPEAVPETAAAGKPETTAAAGADPEPVKAAPAAPDMTVEDEKAPKAPTKPEEVETDAVEDSRPRKKGGIRLSVADCTMDVTASSDGSLVSSLNTGAFQHLVSGVRATAGAKAGRYFFEVSLVERSGGQSMCRVGFSLQRSSLFLGDASCEGRCFFEATPKWNQSVVGVLLNLQEGSPNAFTSSLFINGVRATEPKPLADSLKEAVKGGEGLFPTISFNNWTLICNFGESGLLKPLPFKVRMFNDIAQDDAVQGMAGPKGGKCEVVVPVGLPEQGLFDWADKFLEANPSFVELSDRSLHTWCKRSQLQNRGSSQNESRDKPNFGFGIKDIDNRSGNSTLNKLARVQRRNYLVLEAKGNLLKAHREDLVKRFSAPCFKKRAVVAVGEPKQDFKNWVHKTIKSKFEKKRQMAKALAEKRAALKANQKGAAGAAEAKDEPPEEKEPEVGADVWFLPKANNMVDMSSEQISSNFEKFDFPSKDEGFDEISYDWLDESSAQSHLKKWQQERKVSEVVKGLKPSDWYKDKLKAFRDAKNEFRKKHGEYTAAKRKEKKDEPEEFEDKEPSACTDANDFVGGAPLYARFDADDWTLLTWRYELYLLASGFKHDVQDPDRPGLPIDHLAHYYKLYLNAPYNSRALGCKDLSAILQLLKEVAVVSGDKAQVLLPVAGEEADILHFMKQTEDARRERSRRIDAGDESCILRIPKNGGGQGGGNFGGGKRPQNGNFPPAAKFARW